jgi:REP element-mobilizing transposase RayT
VIVDVSTIRYNRAMAGTIGYHIVISGYGLWLPGDQRGSWSAKWDEELGLIEPHMLHPGDPVRMRMAEERMQRPPVRLNAAMTDAVVDTLAQCAAESEWSIVAAGIMPTHSHLLLTYTERPIDRTIKWMKDRLTKAVHERTSHTGPVWRKGKWRSFIFAEEIFDSTREYIEQDNVRRGMGPRPYAFVRWNWLP